MSLVAILKATGLSKSLEVLVLARKIRLVISEFACGGLVKHSLEVYTATSGVIVDVCCDEVYVCWSLCHVILPPV